MLLSDKWTRDAAARLLGGFVLLADCWSFVLFAAEYEKGQWVDLIMVDYFMDLRFMFVAVAKQDASD